MQERLIYTNTRGESIEFSTTSIYHCNVSTDVDGLSDIESDIYTSTSIGQIGDTYLGYHIEPKEIDVAGSINIQDKSLALAARRTLSRVLSPALSGTLLYIADDYRRVINVKPEKAPVVTRKKVLFNFSIQFNAPTPLWEKETETKNEIASWIGALEFDSDIDATDGMIFGYREPSVIANIYNDGDIETGIRIVFRAIGSVDTPQVLHLDTGGYIQINNTMLSGDVITVNTNFGKKSASLTRNGVESDYYRYVDVDSTFLQLSIADNLLRYAASDGVDNLEVDIYHNDKYLGV